jgi:hypothetical protein
MPNTTLNTSFWQKAAQSLPAPYRARYLAQFEHAERFELALDALVELFSRVKGSFHARTVRIPRNRTATEI